MKERCEMSDKPYIKGRDVASVLNGAKYAAGKEPFGQNGHTSAASQKTPYNWREHVRSLHDLQEMELTRKPDLVEGIIPHGLTAIAGRPKAGKSALILQMGLAISGMMTTVLNERCAKGRVLYLALEENRRRLQDRVYLMLGRDGADEQLNPFPWADTFDYVTADDQWPDWPHGGLDLLTEYVKEHPETTVVMIDSAPLFRGPIPKQGGYDVDYAFTNALANWVNTTGVSLVVTWHTTKSKMTDDLESDPLAMLQNTTGVAAGLDTGIVMARKDGVMMLYRRGRDLDNDGPIKLRDSKETLLWIPDASLTDLPARDAVMQAMTVAKAPMLPKTIASLMGFPPATIRKAIQRMLQEDRPPIGLCDKGYYLTSRGESNQP